MKFLDIFKSLYPPDKPKVDEGFLRSLMIKNNLDPDYDRCIIGIRGFYSKTNERGVYDDAIFICSPSSSSKSFNANTDPGAYRKGIANLKTGRWYYRLGIHGLSKPKILQYEALVQAKKVTVHRDQVGDDTGWFGINIHKGSRTSVSSIGCQTIHPSQWGEFIRSVSLELEVSRKEVIQYILCEMDGSYEK